MGYSSGRKDCTGDVLALMVAAILLSNTVGSFPTKEFCRKTVGKAYSRYGRDLDDALDSTDSAEQEETVLNLTISQEAQF